MSNRAKAAALKAYPVHSVLILPARRGGYYADNHLRDGFVKGYEQAEKDLALTKDDVWCIFNLVRELQTKYPATEGCLQDVADIFNEQRKK